MSEEANRLRMAEKKQVICRNPFVEKIDQLGFSPAASWQICRERSCAVPFGRVAEGVKLLPYENNQAKVDILAPFRLFVADDCCRKRSCAVPHLGVSRKGSSPFRTNDHGNAIDPTEICRERSCAVPFGRMTEGVKPLPYERS